MTAALIAISGLTLTSCDRFPAARQHGLEQQYWVENYATGLNRPRALAWLPNGEVLLAQWDGSIKVLKNDKIVGDVVGGPEVFKTWYQGLRDMKLDPDFENNHFVYLSYMSGNVTASEAPVSGKVWRARLEGHRLVDGKEIFSSTVNKNGFMIMGPLTFLPDKTLLVPVGSMVQMEIGVVQRHDNHLGKIIRINRDGSVPRDNPFVNDPKMMPEVYALGLRNPSGVARTDDGTIWVTDIGPKAGDELNILKPGANYGWPLVTWGYDYSGEAMAKYTGSARQDGMPGMTDPVVVWVPSQVPSGLMQYRGKAFSFWDGDLFTGGLRSNSMRRMRIKNGKVVLQEVLLTDLKERIRTVQQGPDGLIYILTDSYNTGRILRLHPGTPPAGAHLAKALQVANADDRYGEQNAPDELKTKKGSWTETYVYTTAKGEASFMKYCSSCHNFGKFKTGNIGPGLTDVNGRKSGTLPGFSYSAALKDPERQVVWNYLTLYGFLPDPQAFLPGMAMEIPPIPPEERVNIVNYLTHGELSRVYLD